MSNLDALSVCERLENEKTLDNLFEIMRDYGDAPAALWLKGEQELSCTFAEMAHRADDYAACIAQLAPDAGWVGIAVDTCHDWPSLYWGVMRSGHNALLLDASAPDNVIQGLLDEAGCRVIISRKPRALAGNVRQIDFKEIREAPRAIGFTPVWGEYTAMCTSGTTGTSRIFAYNGTAICEQALNGLTLYNTNPRIVRPDNRGRKTLAFLPFHHVLGFMGNVILVSFLGSANVYLQDRTPNSIINTCRHFPPNLLIMVPLVGNSLVRSVEKGLKKESKARRSAFKSMKALSLARQSVSPEAGLAWAQEKAFAALNENLLGTEVDVIILGGSHTPTETLRTLNALGYYTVTGYGMTETGINGFELGMDLKHRLNGSVGKPLRSAEYRIVPEK
jgi:long-subunit acyl-CoA synthetase (AMP-forming)